MEEVAKLADVSMATVSRALRDPETVSPALREKVREASARLGYSRNPLAGSLAGLQAPLVGAIVASMTNSFFAGTLEAMSSELESGGFQLMTGHHDYDLEREERIVAAFAAWNPSALVVTGVHHTRATTNILAGVSCPVVEMWDLDGRPLDTMIGFSNRDAGRAAAAHLLAAGRRKLVYVGSTLAHDTRAKARSEGFREQIERDGDARVSVETIDGRTVGDGCRAFRKVLRNQPDVDAIAFSSDALAFGAVSEARRQGVSIPDDIAVLGYGDLDFAPYTDPALSTIRPPRDKIGELVARHILRRINDPDMGSEIIDLGFDVVVRESG